MEKYFYSENNHPFGPVSIDTIKKKIIERELKKESLIWYQGLPDWQLAFKIPEFASLFENVPPPLPNTSLHEFDNSCKNINFSSPDLQVNKKILAPVKLKNKWGFINQNGETVIPNKYNEVGTFSEGIVDVGDYSQRGYIDSTNNEIIPQIYENTSPFCEGLARVVKNNYYGFVDKNGNVIVPFVYNEVSNFSGGFATVKKYKKTKNDLIEQTEKKIINIKGNEMFSREDIFSLSSFNENLAFFKKGDGVKIGKTYWNLKYGYLNKSFVEVIPAIYNSATHFVNGYATVSKFSNICGVIDKTGVQIIDFKFNNLRNFYDGLAHFRNEGIFGKEGYINIDGDIVIKSRTFYSNFCEGMALGEEKGKYGFINTEGSLIVPFKYMQANAFKEGVARVKSNRGNTFIDKDGNEILSKYYDNAYDFNEGFAPVCKNEKWGFVNKLGIEVIPLEFEEVGNFKNINSSFEVCHNGTDIGGIWAI